jgi:hypothetical protein
VAFANYSLVARDGAQPVILEMERLRRVRVGQFFPLRKISVIELRTLAFVDRGHILI